LWSLAKYILYAEKIRNVNYLREGTDAAIRSSTPDIFQRVWTEIECQLDICHVVNSAHIKMYWQKHLELHNMMIRKGI
jgi:hypothetical protein